MVYSRKVKTLIEEDDNKRVYSVRKKFYGVSFIDDRDKDVFYDYLYRTIMEALRREPI